ncbi:ATP-dependent endonuclease [Halalkalibacter sp. AB-rgal2]|uniref:ATP-dependent nuclease n=1 Tax=Halalkalibacter sp. AB-rgal2 TaxID=3242695 RepID=UPI00359EB046
MYISNLFVYNYRSLKKVHLQFNTGRNVLVGKNNSGKSNIIKAIDLLLGEKMPSYQNIELKDFYTEKTYDEFSDEEDTFVATHFFICAKLQGANFNKELLEKCKGIFVSQLGEKRWWYEDENDIRHLENLFTRDADSFWKDDKEWVNRNRLYDYLTNATEIYFYLNVERQNDDADNESQYSKTFGLIIRQGDMYYRGWAISKDFRDSVLTSAIIPAFRDPNNQFKLSQWSWYGKLIRDIWDKKDKTVGEQINRKVEEIKQLSDQVFRDATSDIKEKLSEAIHHNKVHFQLMPNTKDDIYKGVNLFVDDGVESLAADKGSGIQSALIISLFSYYCSQFHRNSSLLAVEEPELYLHPHARRVLSNKFDEFIEQNGFVRNQVITATHSPEFLRNTEIENITVVRKPKASNKTEVKKIDTQGREKEIQKIKQVLWSKNAELFFADKVILVEGGEEYIFPFIANDVLQKENALDYHNISVIKVGGKSLFHTYLKLLKDLNIEAYVVADFDFFTNGIESLKDFIMDYSSENIAKAKKQILTQCCVDSSDPFRNSKTIKKKFQSGKAKLLCQLLDKMCEDGKYDESLEELWSQFRTDVTKKASYSDFEQNDQIRDLVDTCFENLKKSNIYILKYGELEDYMTEKAVKYLEDQRVSGKELSVLKLVEAVVSGGYKLEEFLSISEYASVIQHAVGIHPQDERKVEETYV